MLLIIRLLLIFILFLPFVSCQDHHLETYEAPITSLFYVLTPDSGQAVVCSFIDNDGLGGNPSLVNNVTLASNTTYLGQLAIGSLNPLASPRLSHVVDSTTADAHLEIHQVFYEAINGLNITTTYKDFDINGYPVGMETMLKTGSAGNGQLVISILHKPNKAAPNVIDGNRTRAEGSIDVEATFNVSVQ